MSIDKTLEPTSKGWGQPRDLNTRWIILEVSWHSEVSNSSDAVYQEWGHDNLTINGENHISHCASDDIKDTLKTLNLLEEEYIEWNSFSSVTERFRSAKSLEFFIDFNLNKVCWELLNQFLVELVLDLIFTGSA